MADNNNYLVGKDILKEVEELYSKYNIQYNNLKSVDELAREYVNDMCDITRETVNASTVYFQR